MNPSTLRLALSFQRPTPDEATSNESLSAAASLSPVWRDANETTEFAIADVQGIISLVAIDTCPACHDR